MNARLTVSRSSHVCLSLAKPSHLTLLSKRVRRETRRSRNLGPTTPKEHRSEPHSYSHPAYRELDDHRAGSGPMTVPVGQLTVEDLLSPSLPGASCTGMAPHFDDVVAGESLEDREARLACAVRVCEHCPAAGAVPRAARRAACRRDRGVGRCRHRGRAHAPTNEPRMSNRTPAVRCTVDRCPYLTRHPDQRCPLHRIILTQPAPTERT